MLLTMSLLLVRMICLMLNVSLDWWILTPNWLIAYLDIWFYQQIDPHIKKRHVKIPKEFAGLVGKNDPTTHGHKVPDLKEEDLKVLLDNLCGFTEKVDFRHQSVCIYQNIREKKKQICDLGCHIVFSCWICKLCALKRQFANHALNMLGISQYTPITISKSSRPWSFTWLGSFLDPSNQSAALLGSTHPCPRLRRKIP